MELVNITFRGPEFEVISPVVDLLAANLIGLLAQINGFVQFGGGLHVRGVCAQPTWHSIADVMIGPRALTHQYEQVLAMDAPFAQNCMADQFLLRDGLVHKLQSETGELRSLDLRLAQFFAAVEADPVDFLAMHPLLHFQREGNRLEPGQVLQAYPPFCTKEAASSVDIMQRELLSAAVVAAVGPR